MTPEELLEQLASQVTQMRADLVDATRRLMRTNQHHDSMLTRIAHLQREKQINQEWKVARL